MLVLTLALSGYWLERANARTLSRGVFSPSQFIALLLDNTVDQVCKLGGVGWRIERA